ncbi:TSUP family transporter [Aliamphritea spongicola]
MEFDALLLLLLFATGLVAGFVDSIAGGGGLIALPVLLSTGMPPLMALGTNKLQGSFGTLAASVYFIRKRLVNLRQMRLMILMTFVGAMAGTLLVQQIDASVLALIMPGLLVLMALYFMFSKKVQDEDTDRRLGPLAFALSCTTVVGFYDGFWPGHRVFLRHCFCSPGWLQPS